MKTLSKQLKIAVLLIVVGCFLFISGMIAFAIGMAEKSAAAGASMESVDVDLAKLEAGAMPPDNHLKIGPHYACYRDMVYQYSVTRGSKPTERTPVSFAYYPIISSAHPWAKQTEPLIKKYGGLERVPKAELPPTSSFVVLVKTNQFNTIGDLPTQPVQYRDSLQGLVINHVDSLTNDEKKKIQEEIPNVDFNKILIVEADRKPMSRSSTWFLVGGGLCMAILSLPLNLGGGMWMIWLKIADNRRQQRRQQKGIRKGIA
jgi:hypothetical protein